MCVITIIIILFEFLIEINLYIYPKSCIFTKRYDTGSSGNNLYFNNHYIYSMEYLYYRLYSSEHILHSVSISLIFGGLWA